MARYILWPHRRSLLANYMGKTAAVSGQATGDLIRPEKVVVDGKEVNIKGMM